VAAGQVVVEEAAVAVASYTGEELVEELDLLLVAVEP